MSAEAHSTAQTQQPSSSRHSAPTSASKGVPTHTYSAPAPTGGFAVPGPARRETGPLSWNRATARDLVNVDQPQPRMRQLMGVCGWAAVLGLFGLVIGIVGLVQDLMGAAPGWYEPAMIVVGILGIGLTVGAFVTVNRARLPYALLGLSTVSLFTAMALTANAF